MVFFLFVHLFSILLYQGYRRPREMTWMGGFLLFILTLAFGFSGYLLPWISCPWQQPRSVPMPHGHWEYQETGSPCFCAGRGCHRGYPRRFLPSCLGTASSLLPLLALHLFMVQLQGVAVPSQIEREGNYRYLPSSPTSCIGILGSGWSYLGL